jgi:DNA polymerase alpha subunit A
LGNKKVMVIVLNPAFSCHTFSHSLLCQAAPPVVPRKEAPKATGFTSKFTQAASAPRTVAPRERAERTASSSAGPSKQRVPVAVTKSDDLFDMLNDDENPGETKRSNKDSKKLVKKTKVVGSFRSGDGRQDEDPTQYDNDYGASYDNADIEIDDARPAQGNITAVETKPVLANLDTMASSAALSSGSAPAPVARVLPQKAASNLPSATEMFGFEVAEIKDDPLEEAADAASDKQFESLSDDAPLRMYWFDACEERGGKVFLFGKINEGSVQAPKYASCCLSVEGIDRNVFFLPRPFKLERDGTPTDVPISLDEVHAEVQGKLRSMGITKKKVKPVKRKYMFGFIDPHVPPEAFYYKVSYPFSVDALASDTSGASFSRVFGTTAGALELLLLKRKIKGPCWLEIRGATKNTNPLSWCKHEFQINSPKRVSVCVGSTDDLRPPTLNVVSLNMQTILKGGANEIAMVSIVAHPSVNFEGPTPRWEKTLSHQFTAIRKLDEALPMGFEKILKTKKPTAEIHQNERSLLNMVTAKLQTIDPDVIVGHNFLGFSLDVLLHRMQAQKIVGWSRLGRLRRTIMPKLQGGGRSSYGERAVMSGRLVCDTYLVAKELLLRETSYGLVELCRSQLKCKVDDSPDINEIPLAFSESDTLFNLMNVNETSSGLALSLMFKLAALPLFKQLTNLAGNLLSRSLTGARAERVEYLLLHRFYGEKYVLPDKLGYSEATSKAAKVAPHKGAKSTVESKSERADALEGEDQAGDGDDDEWDGGAAGGSGKGRRKPQYLGGLVLEPKRGLYDKFVLLLDFNSLYPSIIQEFNICFTTVSYPGPDAPYMLPMPQEQGKLPQVLAELVAKRKEVKKLMERETNPFDQERLNIRQLALKILANSTYGCLGFSGSRFYAKPLAELITSKGREILQLTVSTVKNELGMEVVYGDTDSIMVDSGCEDILKAREMANKVSKAISKSYKLLELGVDGIYRPLLLLQKKKYAAVAVKCDAEGKITGQSLEKKGLDLVRRDWCVLSKEVGEKVLGYLMSGKPREEVLEQVHDCLRKTADDIRSNRIPVESFVITKGLTKDPSEYPDAKNQPHVVVALAMRAEGKNISAGMHIPYVVCKPLPGQPAGNVSTRAFSVDALKKDPSLQIDTDWYFSQQLHPPISRLCAVIEGTDSARIAECLGLDGSKFHSTVTHGRESEESFTLVSSDESFRNATKVFANCNKCNSEVHFEGPFRLSAVGKWVDGFQCPDDSCGGCLPISSVRAAAHKVLRQSVSKYFDCWLTCSEQTCGLRTRQMSLRPFYDDSKALPELGRCCIRKGCNGQLKEEYSTKDMHLQLQYLCVCIITLV